MSIVITGGTGFVGLAVSEALQQAGRDIVLFGRDDVPARFAPFFNRTSFVAGDIAGAGDVDRLLAATDVEAVIHLAAVTPDRDTEMRDPASVIAVNTGGTANLMRSVSRLASRPRVIVASSVAVYGEEPPDGGVYREDQATPSPTSLYGITKLAAEATAVRLATLYGIDLTIVRIGPVYGPWEYKAGLRSLLSPHGQVPEIWERGEDVVLPRPLTGDWLYSRDAGRGIATLLSAEAPPHRTYNLGGERMTSVADWCEALQSLPGARGWRLAAPGEKANLIFGLGRDRAALDVARIRTDIGFQPAFSGDAAAKDYMNWLAMIGHEP
jgi:UDP-glucose 4-epimerase